MPTFIVKNNPDFTLPLQLDPDDERHIVLVLRAQVGETLQLTNNEGGLAQARIIQLKPLEFEILQKDQQAPPRLLTVNLPLIAQDRLEWAVEKLTELNVKKTQLVTTARTQSRTLPAAKWQRLLRIAITAQKQCGRAYGLEILEPVPLNEKIIAKDSFQIVAQKGKNDQSSDLILQKAKTNPKNIEVFVGPEGGFSPEENELFTKQGCHKMDLGPTQLRTETAILTLVSRLQS